MTYPISVGQKFGALTVCEIQSQGAGRPRRIKCLCDCGKLHATNANRLYLNQTTRCQTCVVKRYSKEEYQRRQNYHNYLNGAVRRGYDWKLSLNEFLDFTDRPCAYCGLTPAKGVDRRNNKIGYLLENCTPCCKDCNLAKRDMSEKDFFAWLHRLAQHQEAWL